VLLGFDRR